MNYRTVFSKLNFSILVFLFFLGFGGCSIQTAIVIHDQAISWTDEYKKLADRDEIIRALFSGANDDWEDVPLTEADKEKHVNERKWPIGSVRKDKNGDYFFSIGNDEWEKHDEWAKGELLWGDSSFVEQPLKMAAFAWAWWVPFIAGFLGTLWVRWLFRP